MDVCDGFCYCHIVILSYCHIVTLLPAGIYAHRYVNTNINKFLRLKPPLFLEFGDRMAYICDMKRKRRSIVVYSKKRITL